MLSESRLRRCFYLAKCASEFGTFKRLKLGAVIMYKNTVLSVGWNTNTESQLQAYYNRLRNFDPRDALNSAYAEMNAIRRFRQLLKRSDYDFRHIRIFVYRQYKDGTTALAKPCAACMQAIIDSGIRHVYYTTHAGYEYIDTTKLEVK